VPKQGSLVKLFGIGHAKITAGDFTKESAIVASLIDAISITPAHVEALCLFLSGCNHGKVRERKFPTFTTRSEEEDSATVVSGQSQNVDEESLPDEPYSEDKVEKVGDNDEEESSSGGSDSEKEQTAQEEKQHFACNIPYEDMQIDETYYPSDLSNFAAVFAVAVAKVENFLVCMGIAHFDHMFVAGKEKPKCYREELYTVVPAHWSHTLLIDETHEESVKSREQSALVCSDPNQANKGVVQTRLMKSRNGERFIGTNVAKGANAGRESGSTDLDGENNGEGDGGKRTEHGWTIKAERTTSAAHAIVRNRAKIEAPLLLLNFLDFIGGSSNNKCREIAALEQFPACGPNQTPALLRQLLFIVETLVSGNNDDVEILGLTNARNLVHSHMEVVLLTCPTIVGDLLRQPALEKKYRATDVTKVQREYLKAIQEGDFSKFCLLSNMYAVSHHRLEAIGDTAHSSSCVSPVVRQAGSYVSAVVKSVKAGKKKDSKPTDRPQKKTQTQKMKSLLCHELKKAKSLLSHQMKKTQSLPRMGGMSQPLRAKQEVCRLENRAVKKENEKTRVLIQLLLRSMLWCQPIALQKHVF
jgi:hypothetical protein